MVHRNKVEPAVLAVDLADELGDLTLELRAVGERGRRDLDEHNLADPLGVVVQELLERSQLLHDALHDVQFVAPNDDLLARLIQARDASGNPIGRSELTAEALTQLVAGSDTMSISTCALLFHVVSNEEVLSKLREELDAALPNPDHIPTYEAVKDLP